MTKEKELIEFYAGYIIALMNVYEELPSTEDLIDRLLRQAIKDLIFETKGMIRNEE